MPEIIVTTLTDIYTAYPPPEKDRTEIRTRLFTVAFDAFLTKCRDEDADSPDSVELILRPGENQVVWDMVKKRLPQFETVTKLTIYQNRLMTIVRAEDLKKKDKAKPVEPLPAKASLETHAEQFEQRTLKKDKKPHA